MLEIALKSDIKIAFRVLSNFLSSATLWCHSLVSLTSVTLWCHSLVPWCHNLVSLFIVTLSYIDRVVVIWSDHIGTVALG